MDLFSHPCPCCKSIEIRFHTRYQTKAHGSRTIYHCRKCDIYFSETFATPIAGLTTPLSRIMEILKARSEGMGLNATARTFNGWCVTFTDGERRYGNLLFEICHEVIRRRNSAFRRKTNTYAKSRNSLQRTLDVYWLVHNFVRVHFTTKLVPAVKLGILTVGISWSQLLTIRFAI